MLEQINSPEVLLIYSLTDFIMNVQFPERANIIGLCHLINAERSMRTYFCMFLIVGVIQCNYSMRPIPGLEGREGVTDD